MKTNPSSLDELRGEIDRIDDGLHDLLMERTRIVEQIRKTKGGSRNAVYLRPGREAQVIRRLLGRHQGPFPKVVIARLWREIMSAFTALQGPFAVAIYAEEEEEIGTLIGLAREHYGTYTPLAIHRSQGQVIRAVADGKASVGILPVPQEGSPSPWWTSLMATQTEMPRVVGRLPFVTRPDLHAEAVAIACIPPEETGDDVSWLGIDTPPDFSRARLIDDLREAGFENMNILDVRRTDEILLSLVEVAGCVKTDDPRLSNFVLQDQNAHRVVVLGGYATPLSCEALLST